MASSMPVHTSAFTTKLSASGSAWPLRCFCRKFFTGNSKSTQATAPKPYTQNG